MPLPDRPRARGPGISSAAEPSFRHGVSAQAGKSLVYLARECEEDQWEGGTRSAVDFDRAEAGGAGEDQTNRFGFLGWFCRSDLDDGLLGNAYSDVGVLHRAGAWSALTSD